ncbi:MAG: tetratricopeptide repeat protein, partial [bacterium]|nr:tetratricopeptide repeat protein [bacterium]
MERESEGWPKVGLVVGERLQRLGTNSLDPETVADALQGLIDRSSRKTARTITPRVNLAPDVGDPVDQSQDRGRLLSNALRMVEKGQFQKAIDLYKQLLEIEPKDSRVHLKIGDLFLKTGETELAVGAYAEVARLYGEQGFYKKAIAVRKQIVSIVPSRVEHQRRLIALYHVVGLSAEFSEALNQLAKTYQEQGND